MNEDAMHLMPPCAPTLPGPTPQARPHKALRHAAASATRFAVASAAATRPTARAASPGRAAARPAKARRCGTGSGAGSMADGAAGR